ncbi:hypothetical protein AB3Y13_20435 [Vibrio alginolyticus]|uniref:hypothetical protein n=1 Tax=Vibrio sp. B1FLJ16 TaxID=2751178 RepID=UPI0015F50B2D|nr:hypothetical protein [Vibrio sp. B1FLJ16]CAD7811071.1 hypothetical protein ACOMICROBIO_FLGHMIGD_02288 [Vibrio sp. B1FLJ16]CAD7811838.1 hypothetical protein ACOMICROBIO_EPCKBFOG_02415 [Vibrio sp. B1FLJ16]CAE6913979.1 hypothetical protein ACOMICROBIO_FLGHMIGD_02288 [Vibrio sp. B1FLJ16]CAE6917316.1 hypothetical protein ACOMICROBIO_EPCKBFOG_02415 [Vibrio sp. B1FLJ16]
MNNDALKKLLERYQQAEKDNELEAIVRCSNQLKAVLDKIAPVKEQLGDESKALVIELQITHVRVLEKVKAQREEMKVRLEGSQQYKDRAKAYTTTQLAGLYIS